MSKKKLLYALLFTLGVIYFFGPKPDAEELDNSFPAVNSNLVALSDSINYAEFENKNVKANNNAQIIFANDSLPQKTEWAVVYIHGFSASRMEGYPIHIDFAKKHGMNIYMARLTDHGIDTSEALLNMTPKRLWESAKKALAIGEQIGDKVILMSTSTGGTLSLMLASKFPDKVSALMNFSPNIRVNSPVAFLLNDPWGLQIARLAKGGNYNITGPEDDETAKYWQNKYRLEAIVNLEELVESNMTEETFSQVVCPSLTLCYYKDQDNQDPTVKVEAIEWMHDNLSSKQKKLVKLPNVGVHPIASYLVSKDLESVASECNAFALEVLNIQP